MQNDLLRGLRDELQADYSRPEGRWGIHGHSAVDDDYFVALEYVIKRIDALIEAASVPADKPAAIMIDGTDEWLRPGDPRYDAALASLTACP